MNNIKLFLQNFTTNSRYGKTGASVFILLIIPLTIFVLQRTQILKSRAATTPGSYGYGGFGENVYGTFIAPSPSVTEAVTVTPSTPITPDIESPTPEQEVTRTPTTPPPTIMQGNTSISITLLLHGLGKGGDNVNPNSGGNPNPLRPQRNVKVEILNAQNQVILSKDGDVRFNPAEGNFKGVIDLGPTLSSGVYNVKVKSPQFLRSIIPGIHNITHGQNNVLPQVTLKTADMNDDNKIDVLDYNTFNDCFSTDLTPARDCADPAKKQRADITDDGDVNQFDYNLYLREVGNFLGE